MKRFIIFVIICIVSLGIGFTVFRFMSHEEFISVSQTVFQVNTGEEIKLDVITEHLKRDTVISTEITQTESADGLQKIDEYTYMAKKGGQYVITLSSSSNIIPIKIQITVGDGGTKTPFFIRNAELLASIGKSYTPSNETTITMPLSSSYALTTDISLLDVAWTPIADGDESGFTGRFDFNGHSINGLKISAEFENAGLFAKIGTNGEVFNGTIRNCTINSNASYVGALAGINAGDISGVSVVDSSVKTTKVSGVAGGLVGLNNATMYKTISQSTDVYADETNGVAGGLVGVSQTISTRANITLSSSISSVSANVYVGGLVGKVVGSTVENCFVGDLNSTAKLSSANNACYIGGVVGSLEGINSNVGVLKDTYSAANVPTSNTTYVGAILGVNKDEASTSKNKIFGNYYSAEVSGLTNAVAGMTDPANPHTSDFGVYNKDKQSLISDIPSQYKDDQKVTPIGTYYSCVSTDNTANYYWDFENIWLSNASQNQLPTINAEAKYVATNLEIAGISGTVNSVQSFKAMDESGNYRLTGNFTIDRDSAYIIKNFNGSLIGETIADGTPAYTITVVVDSEDQLLDGAFALFNTLGKNAIIQNVNVNITLQNVVVNNVAGLALTNKGRVLNCASTGTIRTNVSAVKEFMAGLVADNYGTIQDCTSSVDLTLNGSPSNMYIGGVVAYNSANAIVEGSKNTGTISVATTSTVSGYIGGVVGQSDSKVTTSVNTGSISCQGNLSNVYVGGVVGNVNGGYLTKSSNHDNTLRATNVGGVAGFVSGYISECMSQSTLNGDKVGGLVCSITKNYITNSISQNNLIGYSDSSILNGIAYSFNIYDKASYGTYIFTACTFGQGEKWFETISDVRGANETREWRDYPECLENCIYVNDLEGSSGAKRSVMPYEWLGWMFGYYYDCPISDAQAKGSDNYSAFYDNGYSTDIWSFSGDAYPELKNVAK